jgi:GNAT superfamily N-acetyltransferase
MDKIDLFKFSMANVKVHFLEMRTPASSDKTFANYFTTNKLSKPIRAAFYRDLYYGVGKPWSWLDRMVMTDRELETQLNAEHVSIYTIQVDGHLAGFAEFVLASDYVEILYFGLLPDYIGRGIGKHFLQWVIEKAWSFQPKWIQLNTCALDHPNALPVYLKSGFTIVREEMQERKVLIE